MLIEIPFAFTGLIKLQNVKVNRIYIDTFTGGVISVGSYNRMYFFGLQVDGAITGG